MGEGIGSRMKSRRDVAMGGWLDQIWVDLEERQEEWRRQNEKDGTSCLDSRVGHLYI